MSIDQDFDVAIVGGGPAGLSAALILGRAVRKVIVFDQGAPRNAPSREAHSVFTRDGTPPPELLTTARQQLKPYDVTILDAEVSGIQKKDEGFELITTSDMQAAARKVILCTGRVDLMPDIPAIEQFWGKTVVHCPYCHGWELRDEPVAALVNRHSALNFASLLNGWSNDLVLLSNGLLDIDFNIREQIDAHGIPIIEDNIRKLAGSDGMLEEVVFENGKTLGRKALFIDPKQKLRSDLYRELDLEYDKDGDLKINRFGETSLPGMYVAGDAAPGMQQITIAAASGAEIAIGVNHKLLEEDFNNSG